MHPFQRKRGGKKRTAAFSQQPSNTLTLARQVGETVRIGETVSITVMRVDGNRVCIGVNAPKDLVVNRSERHKRDASRPD